VFPERDAATWLTGRPEAALYDLSPAALLDGADPEPAARPDPVTDLPEAPAGVSVETLLATEYGVHPEQVVLTAGADAARFVAFAAALELSEGPALVESPANEALIRTPEALGRSVERFERPAPNYGAEPDLDSPAVVALSNRHDPSGRLLAREALSELAGRAADAGGRLLVDESVAPLTPDPEDEAALGGVTAAGLDGAVVTGSLERVPGLAGQEVGWVVGDPAVTETARRVQRYVGAVPGTSRVYARRALYRTDGLVERAREICRENSATLAAGLAARPDTTCRVFEDAPVALLSVEGTDGDALAGAAWDAGVLVVPGKFFGEPGMVRIGLGRSPERVRAGLDALGGVLDDLRAARERTNP